MTIKVLEQHENEEFILILSVFLNDEETLELKPYRITCTRKVNGSTEVEDYETEGMARAQHRYYLEVCGLTNLVVLPPANPTELFATWWMRIHQTKQRQPAQDAEEDAMLADPDVQAWCREMLPECDKQKGWPTVIIRRVLETLAKEQRASEVKVLSGLPNFGRFGF